MYISVHKCVYILSSTTKVFKFFILTSFFETLSNPSQTMQDYQGKLLVLCGLKETCLREERGNLLTRLPWEVFRNYLENCSCKVVKEIHYGKPVDCWLPLTQSELSTVKLKTNVKEKMLCPISHAMRGKSLTVSIVWGNGILMEWLSSYGCTHEIMKWILTGESNCRGSRVRVRVRVSDNLPATRDN